ncbi:MAG: redox-sensing transcriptional repressor Rex [Chloroflexi bacterium]|nr:MAG: redox-sensing transcriptional repressor Rex [Chloroflexota bacterium]
MVPLEIPEVVIDRLPTYYRLLSRLQEEGSTVVSSQELGQALNVTPAQIRKDLSYFGRFGKQGRGYSVERLTEELRLILGLTRRWRMVLVGAGHLGRAIASYRGFEPQGFDIVAAYDIYPDESGELLGIPVRDVANLEADLAADPVDIGIVAVPAGQAQAVVDRLVRVGVSAILNYAPIAAQVPPHIEVRQIDPVLALQGMTYHLQHRALSATAPTATTAPTAPVATPAPAPVTP